MTAWRAACLHDQFDQTGMSVKITSMPVKPEDAFRVAVGYGAG
jgi:hypothetical protein